MLVFIGWEFMLNWLEYRKESLFNKAQPLGSYKGNGQIKNVGLKDLIKAYIHNISSDNRCKSLFCQQFYEIVALKESILFSQEACEFLNIVGSHVKGNRLSLLVCEPQI